MDNPVAPPNTKLLGTQKRFSAKAHRSKPTFSSKKVLPNCPHSSCVRWIGNLMERVIASRLPLQGYSGFHWRRSGPSFRYGGGAEHKRSSLHFWLPQCQWENPPPQRRSQG